MVYLLIVSAYPNPNYTALETAPTPQRKPEENSKSSIARGGDERKRGGQRSKVQTIGKERRDDSGGERGVEEKKRELRRKTREERGGEDS